LMPIQLPVSTIRLTQLKGRAKESGEVERRC
jgi:hypothetical protein